MLRGVQKRLCGLAALAAVTAAGNGEAARLRPLFNAFQTFCVATDTRPEAVKHAVEQVGGQVKTPLLRSDVLVPMTMASWDVSITGHPLWVSSGTTWASKSKIRHSKAALDFDSCSINSAHTDTASLAAIRQWVGGKPSQVSKRGGGMIIEYYHFRTTEHGRTVQGSKADWQMAEMSGKSWQLMVMHGHGSVSLLLAHYYRAQSVGR